MLWQALVMTSLTWSSAPSVSDLSQAAIGCHVYSAHMGGGPALPAELSSWGGTKRPADSDAASDAAKRGRWEAGRQWHLPFSFSCMFHNSMSSCWLQHLQVQ